MNRLQAKGQRSPLASRGTKKVGSINWQQLTPFLYHGQDILIMVHERPDGDAWGSGLGLGLVLETLGLRPRLLRAQPPSQAFAWLPGRHMVEVIPRGELAIPKDAAVVVVDCGHPDRCEYFLGNRRPLLNADHHASNPYFGILNWVEPRASATALVLCRLLLEEGINIPPSAATCFYTALATDTGGFRFSSTDSETLGLAASLVDAGADLALIRYNLWENRPKAELALLRELLCGMEFVAEGSGILCTLPYELLQEKGLSNVDTDNALENMRSIAGIEAVALLKEVEPGLVKVSLRSKSTLDCTEFMAQWGGGGHVRAAGGTLYGPLVEARQQFKTVLSAALQSAPATGCGLTLEMKPGVV